MIKGEIWFDLEELRAEYSLRYEKYKQKAKEFPPDSKKELYYSKLKAQYLHAWCQLTSLLSSGMLETLMEYEK